MNTRDALYHIKGQSQFIDDVSLPEGTLYAEVFCSPVAHGNILTLDVTKARSFNGVVDIITAKDIPGENQIGSIIKDEPLLAQKELHFAGMPICVVVAETNSKAKEAIKHIVLEVEEREAVIDPRDAYCKGHIINPPRTFKAGDVKNAWKMCETVIAGRVDSDGQEHFYLETQGTIAIPRKEDSIKIISSTQSPTGVQRTLSKILDCPMHSIEVDVLRLGGGFGGKEDQAATWAALAAVAAKKHNRPVKLVLNRSQDMVMTGKRHPYSADYKIGLSREGKILAYEAVLYQNAGAAADLSPAILERTLFHATGSYYIPNVTVTAVSCYTNLVPFTAFRGFGAPQAMFVFESALHAVAKNTGVSPSQIQERNLLQEGDSFPYGQIAEHVHAQRCFHAVQEKIKKAKWKNRVAKFNSKNRYKKKAIYFMPVCFGISFTNTIMNKAGALVHVYSDGSVGISTGAVEMGQGVNEKIRLIAAAVLGIKLEKIKVETTNTTRVANTSPTAASSGADLNGKAVYNACVKIFKRLHEIAAAMLGSEVDSGISFKAGRVYFKKNETKYMLEDVITAALIKRIDLSAHGYYQTPDIWFDKQKEKGHPFAYHVYGCAAIEATVNGMKGTYCVDKVSIVHDGGRSISKLIDQGQIEGGFIQGAGWVTMEHLKFSDKGQLLTDTAGKYKVPDIHFTPEEMDVSFLEDVDNPYAILNSKAVGEPPFMYALGVWFAIVEAARAYNEHMLLSYKLPVTPERLFTMLYSSNSNSI